jgi:hypothetical protein
MYLVEFHYDAYCQGWEDAWTFVLVYANSFEEACAKIKEDYDNASQFKNKTIQ